MQLIHPYRIAGPALISFSGGRTSAYMLRHILDAHGGALPADIVVAFSNTGKEREETLRFVHDCSTYWKAKVRWLEWCDSDAGFDEVGFNSASRNGEPFAGLIAKKSYLPNAVTRFCTQELKIRVMKKFARSLGWDYWTNVIGLRYDEGMRVMRALEANDSRKERWTNYMPLSTAKVTKRDVMAFWQEQSFDLQLRPYEGNCDLCFLKSRKKLSILMRDNPAMAQWWIEQERSVGQDQTGARFVTEYRYADLLQTCRDQGDLFDGWMDDEHDAECGLLCAAE